MRSQLLPLFYVLYDLIFAKSTAIAAPADSPNVNATRLKSYGVWKAGIETFDARRGMDNRDSVHGLIRFEDGIPRGTGNRSDVGILSAAIDLKSPYEDRRLVYWLDADFSHSITEQLEELDQGFHAISEEKYVPALDILRDDFVDILEGTIVAYDVSGPDNDIIDILEPFFQAAIDEEATMYLFGHQWASGNGIHQIHMNQGYTGELARESVIGQDGAVIFQFSDHWEALFLAFAQQATKTADDGIATGPTFAELLL